MKTPGRVVVTFVPLVLVLLAATSSLHATEYRLKNTYVDPDKKLSGTTENGGEKYTYGVAERDFTYDHIWKDGANIICSYHFHVTFDPPQKTFKTGDKVPLSLTMTCAAEGKTRERPTRFGARFVVPNGGPTQGLAAVAAAWVGKEAGDGPLTLDADGKGTFTIGEHGEKFSISAVATGCGAVTVWEYEAVPDGTIGATTTTKPPVTTEPPKPPTPPKPPPPRPGQATAAPYLRMALASSKLAPNEDLWLNILAHTGSPPADDNTPARLKLTVVPDTATMDLFWLMASGGAVRPSPGTPLPADSPTWETQVRDRMANLQLAGEVRAPEAPGQYQVVAELRTSDGRTAQAMAAFEVVQNVRGLYVYPPSTANVRAGGSPRVEVGYRVVGIPAGQKAPKVQAWGTIEWMSREDALAGKSFRYAGFLPDTDGVTTAVENGQAEGKVAWTVPCPKAGLVRLSFTVMAERYGARDGEIIIGVVDPTAAGTTTGGGATTTTTGGGATTTTTTGAGGGTLALPPAGGGGTVTTTGGGGGQTQGQTTQGQGGAAPSVFLSGAGLTLADIGGQLVVSAVKPGGWAEQLGIEPGWVLTNVRGQDVTELIPSQVKEVLDAAGQPFVPVRFVAPDGTALLIGLPTVKQ